jgi:hypothetical protein
MPEGYGGRNMKFNLRYLGGDISIGGNNENLSFHGEGCVFIQDAALVFKGNMPKFKTGVLWTIYQKVIYVSSSRTVPYSSILKYKKSSFVSGRSHSITYRLPNGRKCNIKFQMQKPAKKNDQMFATRLQEYLAVASSFSQ